MNKFRFNALIDYDEKYELSTSEIIEIESETSEDVIPCQNCYAVYSRATKKSSAHLWFGCTYFEIRRRVRDKAQRVYADIAYCDNDKELIKRVPVSMLKGVKLETLADFGIDIATDRIILKELGRYFTRRLNQLTVEEADPPVGFHVVADTLRFNGYSENESDPLIFKNSFKTASAYQKTLNTLTAESVPLQFAMAVGISPMVLAFLRMTYHIKVASFCVNFVGKSSTGKTSAAVLSASMYSSPEDRRIFAPFYGTENAALMRLDGRVGITMCWDEGTASSVNIERIVYSVANECQKARGRTDGKLQEQGHWITIPIITSEEPVMDSADLTRTGEKVRLHVYCDLAFTKDAEHAQKIYKLAMGNCGIIAKAMSEYLLTTHENLEEYYEEYKAYISELLDDQPCHLKDRLIEQYAIMILSCELLNALGVEIDTESVAASILAQHYRETAKCSDPAETAYSMIMGYIAANPCDAAIKVYEHKQEIAVVDVEFEAILKRFNLNKNSTIKALDAAGYLKRSEKNRQKVKRSINRLPCYVYLLDTSKQGGEEDEENA